MTRLRREAQRPHARQRLVHPTGRTRLPHGIRLRDVQLFRPRTEFRPVPLRQRFQRPIVRCVDRLVVGIVDDRSTERDDVALHAPGSGCRVLRCAGRRGPAGEPARVLADTRTGSSLAEAKCYETP